MHKYSSVRVRINLLQLYPTLYNPMDCGPPGSSVHGDSAGKNSGVGCHALLQGIFPTQGSNPRLSGLLHGRRVLHQQRPRETLINYKGLANQDGGPKPGCSWVAGRSHLSTCFLPRGQLDKGLSSTKDWGRQSG